MLLLGWMMILHFVADFVFQSREMGQKKSSEFRWLFKHLTIQWLFFAFGLVYFVGPVVAISFATLNCLVHGLIDWNIWNLYKLSAYKRIKAEADEFHNLSEADRNAWIAESGKNWQYWNDHWFYTTIGFDQLLHGLTIIGLFALLV